MVSYLFDTIWMRRSGTTNAAVDAADDDCTRLIPETLAMLEGIYSLSDDELCTLACNLEMLAQCAEDQAERRRGLNMP